MVTLVRRAFTNTLDYVELAGTSKESKPTAGIVSGSKFTEVDTGKTYVFDGISTTAAWTEIIVTTAAAASGK